MTARVQLACLLLAAVATAVAAPARAGGPTSSPDARQLYEQGERHYEAAEYALAIAAWKESYALSKRPLLLFDLGQAYRLSGDCTTAMSYYDRYRQAEPHPANAAALDQAVAHCAPAAPEPPATPPPTTPAPAGPSPTSAQVAVHAVHAAPAGPSSHRTAALITGGIGVALGGAAVYFVVDSHAQNSRVTTGNVFHGDADARGSRDNTLAWVFGAAGGVALAVGVVLAITGHPRAASHVRVSPTAGGAALGWTGTF